jgi:hypothetical protein
MQVAARPRFTAGVALVGAGVIAASTMVPAPDIHLPDVHLPSIRTIDVGLAAAVNPLDVYGKVIQDALANGTAIFDAAKPGQLLTQIFANQMGDAGALGEALQHAGGTIGTALTTQIPALLQTALGQLSAGNLVGATDSVLQIPLIIGLPAADVLPALGQLLTKPLANLVNVVNAFTAPSVENLLVISGLIAPLISTPGAAAAAVQNVINAVGAGDPAAVVNAILTAPATVVDGFLNGGYGPDLGPLTTPGIVVKAGGLLSSAGLIFNDDGTYYVKTGGPLAAFEQILNRIVAAITPPKPATTLTAATDVSAIPSTSPTTVSLAVEPSGTTPTNAAPSADTTTDASAGSGASVGSGQTPAAEGAGDTATKPTGESSAPTAETPAEPAGGTESSAPAMDSADSTGQAQTAAKPSKDASEG